MALYLVTIDDLTMLVRAANGVRAREIAGAEAHAPVARVTEQGDEGFVIAGAVTVGPAAPADGEDDRFSVDVSNLDTPRGMRDEMDPVTRQTRRVPRDGDPEPDC